MKKFITSVILTIVIGLTTNAQARQKFYKSTTNLPFVEMMLNMMVVMGILDQIPSTPGYRSAYGQNPYLANPYLSSMGNPYTGLSGLNGPASLMGLSSMYPGMYTSPYSRMYPGLSRGNYPAMGSPLYAGPRYSRMGYPVTNPLMSSYGVPGVLPLYSNPLLGFPRTSPYRSRQYAGLPYGNYARRNQWAPMKEACSRCKYQASVLNGLWKSENGELLGIKNEEFLWSDGADKVKSGQMQIKPGYVLTRVDGYDEYLPYRYRLTKDTLLMRDARGMERHFVRMPVDYSFQ